MIPTDHNVPELKGAAEFEDQDFQIVLQALLKAYRPRLEQDLRWTESAEALQKEAKDNLPDCEEEIALADQLFDAFLTREVAFNLLGPKAKELGAFEEWAWCWRHVICCLKFGWLLHRARTFRATTYYVHRFWFCIRQSLDLAPVERQLTEEEQADLEHLTTALATVYKPYLEAQLDSLSLPAQIATAVIAGDIDCNEGMEETNQIFERFLAEVQVQQALFGKDAFAKYSQNRVFWFCRCWCLCSAKFGFCLSQANTLLEVLRCLLWYFRCTRFCFQPLLCELTAPMSCVAEEVNTTLPASVVAVKGTAGGANFDHYVLEWSSDSVVWHATDFHYLPIPPGGGTQGNVPVFGGLLAYFDTSAKDAGHYFIRLTVFAVQGTTCIRTIQWSLFKQDVRILGVDGVFALDASALDPAARFVETVPALCSRPAGTFEVSFAECLNIWGSAFVGGCEERKIKRYSLDYKLGVETNPAAAGWTNFWHVDYNTVWQYRQMNLRQDTSVLTSQWIPDCIIHLPPYPCLKEEPEARLSPSCWPTHTSTCGLSGLFTLHLVVEDTLNNLYYDTQRIWIDNKSPCAIIRIDAVHKCSDIYLSQFAQPPDCSVPWNLPISGIAYDEYINDTLPLTRPNDNFDFYWVKVKKQGGSDVQLPIPGPTGTCFYGTSRVGHPGTSCVSCVPAKPAPSATFGTLTLFDLRAVDPLCKDKVGYPVPPDFTISRGECCTYVFTLHVQDRTIFSGGPHWREDTWPVRICNDLKPIEAK